MQIIRDVTLRCFTKLRKRMHGGYCNMPKDILQRYNCYHLEVNIKILWKAFGKIESEPLHLRAKDFPSSIVKSRGWLKGAQILFNWFQRNHMQPNASMSETASMMLVEELWEHVVWDMPELKYYKDIRLFPHCMALDSFRKRIRNGVLSVYFKIGLKVLKKLEISISCPPPLFCLSCKLSGIKAGYTV